MKCSPAVGAATAPGARGVHGLVAVAIVDVGPSRRGLRAARPRCREAAAPRRSRPAPASETPGPWPASAPANAPPRRARRSRRHAGAPRGRRPELQLRTAEPSSRASASQVSVEAVCRPVPGRGNRPRQQQLDRAARRLAAAQPRRETRVSLRTSRLRAGSNARRGRESARACACRGASDQQPRVVAGRRRTAAMRSGGRR